MICLPPACVGELPCGSQPAGPKIGSMTKIVFLQVQHADTNCKIWNLRRFHTRRRQKVLGVQTKPKRRWTTLLDVLQWVQCITTGFINFILSEDVAFVNLTAHDRIKYWLTADNNTCKTTAKFINLMFKKRKELLKM